MRDSEQRSFDVVDERDSAIDDDVYEIVEIYRRRAKTPEGERERHAQRQAADDDGSACEIVKVYRRRTRTPEPDRVPMDRSSPAPPPYPPYPPYPPMPPYPPYVIVAPGGCGCSIHGHAHGGASVSWPGQHGGAIAAQHVLSSPSGAGLPAETQPVQPPPATSVSSVETPPARGESGVGGAGEALLDLADRALEISQLITAQLSTDI
jgi:hypothetical protein